MTRKVLWFVLVAAFGITVHLWASRAAGPRPSVRLRGGDAIAEFASRLVVSAPHRCNDLSVFLVSAPGATLPDVDMTLDQAVKRDLVEVTELGDSEVNRLSVRSRAKEPVFVMGGEMLRGGKQDRIIADDLVLPARAEVTVAVYCVEHGRWALGSAGGGGGGFTAGHSLAPSEVRQAGGGGGRGGGQPAVWDSVARQQRSLKAESATGALRSVHDSQEVRNQIGPYLRAFSDLAEDNPRACGVVAMVGDEVLAADLFSSPTVFRKMWPDLLESYAIDAVERAAPVLALPPEPHITKHAHYPDVAFAQRWLAGMSTASRTPRDTPGAGTLYDLKARAFTGSVLVWDGGVVHAGLLPAVAQIHKERDLRIITPEQRRERLGR